MPIEHKTYGCKFKCGYKHSPDWCKIEDHEWKCWNNPKNRTCVTCKHGERIHNNYFPETGCDYKEWISNFWECSQTEYHNELYEKVENYTDENRKRKELMKPNINCNSWELRK